MILNIDESNLAIIESYKERNLYYKIFAGYLLNEVIPGSEKRKKEFISLLKSIIAYDDRFKGDEINTLRALSEIYNHELHVTFDYHAAQLLKKVDRGEMSDVLLLSKSHFISIECKFLEDMEIKMDVYSVQNRIEDVKKKLKLYPIQVLLLKKSKWDNSKKAKKKENNFYAFFQKINTEIPVLILFWDELLPLMHNNKVSNYLELQIARKK